MNTQQKIIEIIENKIDKLKGFHTAYAIGAITELKDVLTQIDKHIELEQSIFYDSLFAEFDNIKKKQVERSIKVLSKEVNCCEQSEPNKIDLLNQAIASLQTEISEIKK
jgi:preprotein translocase subunit SecD